MATLTIQVSVFGSLLLTNWNGGDLSVDVQHAVAIHIHQVVPPALFIVTEEVDCTNILGRDMFCITTNIEWNSIRCTNVAANTQIINAPAM